MKTQTLEAPLTGGAGSKSTWLRGTAVSIGTLFIFQVVTAATGLSFVQSFLAGEADRATLTIGALLMIFSGALIAAIGVLLYKVLSSTNRTLATWVLALRATEFVVVIIFGIYLLQNSQPVPNHLLWVYILAGTAGVIVSGLLLASRLVPRAIAGLGLLGYSLILLGVALEFTGVIDINAGAGQVFIIPGALFEVVVLPIWLFAKGFNPAAPQRAVVDIATDLPPGRSASAPRSGALA